MRTRVSSGAHDDPDLHAALARAGGFMLAESPNGKLHVFDEDRQFSRCGTVSRSMATLSPYRTDLAAIQAGAVLCRSCFPHVDEQRAALRMGLAS